MEMKKRGEKILQIACYDYSTARIFEEAGVNSILVGDSLVMTMQGHEDNLPVTMDEMIAYVRSVGRACRDTFVIVDMPFMSCQTSVGRQAVENVGRIMKEMPCQRREARGRKTNMSADRGDSRLRNARMRSYRADTVSILVKTSAEIDVIMTKNATEFITPLTFETLTGRRCIVDTFARDFEFDVAHVSLAKAADIILITPATANVIAKLAHGIADDMLTTTVLAAKCSKIVSPSMNTAMLENPITQDNIETLKKYGFEIIEPNSGRLACGDTEKGRLPLARHARAARSAAYRA